MTRSNPTPLGLLHAFRRRWVLSTLIGLAIAVVVAAAVWLVLPGGKHEARALVNLRPRNIEVNARERDDYESYRRNQIFILKTRELLARTVGDAAVVGLTMIKEADDPVRMLEENLSVSAVAPEILAVTLKGNNLDEMKIIVDALVKRYVDDAAAMDRRELIDSEKRLAAAAEKLKSEIEADEAHLRLLVKAGTTGDQTGEGRLAQFQRRIFELETEIARINKGLTQLEAQRKVIAGQLESGKVDADPVLLSEAVAANPQLIKLQAACDAQRRLYESELSVAGGDRKAPVVVEQKVILDKLESELKALQNSLVTQLEVGFQARAKAALRQKLAELDTQIAIEKQARSTTQTQLDEVRTSLRGEAGSHVDVARWLTGKNPKQEQLDKLNSQIAQIRLQMQLDSRASIRESAQPLPNNNLTKKLILCGGASIGTFFVVVLFVSYLEWRTRRVDDVEQVVSELGMRVIGTVPAFPSRAKLNAAASSGNANWRFALNESINSTRTMLLHSARNQSMQVVMVTSATQGEGKTSLASQLASSMATAGLRTLIVDCDLRNPSIHKLFDLGLTPGVSEILTQEADVSDAIQSTVIPNLWVIPAGQCSNRVVAALAQGHPLETLFNRLRGQFDFVIVDSCPVLPVADALLIGQHVDGVVFSIMQDISQLPKVLLATEKLNQLNIPLLGAVVNGIKQDTYSYGYNYVKQLPA
jgi:capsular exopolysaccharide synthesis family protein